MAFKSSLKVNTKNLRDVKRNLAKLNKTEIEFGWINKKVYPTSDKNGRGGIPVAEIAARNEFGGYIQNSVTGMYHYIPSRPYLQQAVQMCKQFNALESEALFHRVLHNLPYQGILHGMAETNAQYVKKSIDMQNMTPLKEKTVNMKGGSEQWKDTGFLVKNITGKVIYKRSGYKGDK